MRQGSALTVAAQDCALRGGAARLCAVGVARRGMNVRCAARCDAAQQDYAQIIPALLCAAQRDKILRGRRGEDRGRGLEKRFERVAQLDSQDSFNRGCWTQDRGARPLTSYQVVL